MWISCQHCDTIWSYFLQLLLRLLTIARLDCYTLYFLALYHQNLCHTILWCANLNQLAVHFVNCLIVEVLKLWNQSLLIAKPYTKYTAVYHKASYHYLMEHLCPLPTPHKKCLWRKLPKWRLRSTNSPFLHLNFCSCTPNLMGKHI